MAIKSCIEQLTMSYILVTALVARLDTLLIIRRWDVAGIYIAFRQKKLASVNSIKRSLAIIMPFLN